MQANDEGNQQICSVTLWLQHEHFYVRLYHIVAIPVYIFQENVNAETDTQIDTLENEKQSNRRATTQESFDGSMTTNNYESSGSYTLKLVTTNRLLRRRRSVELFDMPLAEITSLLATINFSKSHVYKSAIPEC